MSAMSWVSPDEQPYPTQVTASGVTLLRATGRLNFPEVDRLRQQFASLVDSGAVRMAVDLSGVEAIDSAGVGVLISGLKAARSAGGDLRLVAPSMVVVKVLEMMNLDKLLTMHSSPEEAFPG
jgi:anti-sigma B factor antagonist